MQSIQSITDNFDQAVSSGMGFIENNQYLSAILTLLLVTYASLAGTALPSYILRLFDNWLFRLLMLFLIGYTSVGNPTVSLFAAIAVLLTMQALSDTKLQNTLANMLNYGPAPTMSNVPGAENGDAYTQYPYHPSAPSAYIDYPDFPEMDGQPASYKAIDDDISLGGTIYLDNMDESIYAARDNLSGVNQQMPIDANMETTYSMF